LLGDQMLTDPRQKKILSNAIDTLMTIRWSQS